MKQASYYQTTDEGLLCLLCPNHCRLQLGQTGACLSRRASPDGKTMLLDNYALVVAANVDPIEKKPLYHFFPGQPIYSVGSFGCNLHCRFCQNADISQARQPGTVLTPEALLANASSIKNNIGVAFTYNEPGIWFEYICDSAPLLRQAGLHSILVSNGYLSPEPWAELCRQVDAMNIDLKAFNAEFYQKICGGQLETVKNNIVTAVKSGIHIEITHLLITDRNDSEAEFSQLVNWLADLSPAIPLHISRYFPRYQESAPSTDPQKIRRFVEIAAQRLEYVYPGNIAGECNTLCPDCKRILIKRQAHKSELTFNGSACECGKPLPFITAPNRPFQERNF